MRSTENWAFIPSSHMHYEACTHQLRYAIKASLALTTTIFAIGRRLWYEERIYVDEGRHQNDIRCTFKDTTANYD